MWYYFKRLFLFLGILFLLMLLLDVFISVGLRKSSYGNINDWNVINFDSIGADVIINGSSKAWVQVSTKIVDSILDCNSYNLGLDGADFYQQYFKYKFYRINNRQPKTIIQIVGKCMLEKTQHISNLYQYLPYMNNRYVRQLVFNYDNLRYIDCIVPLLRYSKRFDLIKIGLGEFFCINVNYLHDNKYKGFEAQNMLWNKDFNKFKKRYPKGKAVFIDSSLVNMFDTTLNFWRSRGVNVVIVVPPCYYESYKYILNRDSIIDVYRQISKRTKCIFLDYSNIPMSRDRSLFYNSQHLNNIGAQEFTKILCNDIKKEKLYN